MKLKLNRGESPKLLNKFCVYDGKMMTVYDEKSYKNLRKKPKNVSQSQSSSSKKDDGPKDDGTKNIAAV